MLKVSVVMPVYNAESYLNDSITSILKQTYRDFEFIIIDDGSTDNSLSVIKEFKDKRIKIISRENRGIAYSLNQAIEMSSGEYIARMDADDISSEDRLEKQVEYLDNNLQIGLVGSRFKMLYQGSIDDEYKKEMEVFYKNCNEEIDENNIESMLEGYKILHPTWMFRKNIIHEIGGYRECASEDSEFLFRAAMMGIKMARIDEKLLQYRIVSSSKSATDRKKLSSKKSCIEFKLDYIKDTLNSIKNNFQYIIWGADISGKLAYEQIQMVFPNAKLRYFVDGKKKGLMEGYSIFSPDIIKNDKKIDYIFICTRGGAKNAFDLMHALGKESIKDYFKIV